MSDTHRNALVIEVETPRQGVIDNLMHQWLYELLDNVQLRTITAITTHIEINGWPFIAPDPGR